LRDNNEDARHRFPSYWGQSLPLWFAEWINALMQRKQRIS
jgi:hypothetical protein